MDLKCVLLWTSLCITCFKVKSDIYVQSFQFTGEQFACIGHLDCFDGCSWTDSAVRSSTMHSRPFSRMCINGNGATRSANGDIKHVVPQSVLEEEAGTMRDQSISFHFSKSKSSLSGTSVHRLSSEHLTRASGPCMHLVIHHMFQFLVKHWTHKHLGF